MADQAVLVSPDLMLASQVELDCRRSDVAFRTAGPDNWVELSSDAKWVFWDLSHGLPISNSIQELKQNHQFSLIALGPHVDEARLQQARDAGCDKVMARGRFLRELSIILAGDG
jgi:hypothetical protein